MSGLIKSKRLSAFAAKGISAETEVKPQKGKGIGKKQKLLKKSKRRTENGKSFEHQTDKDSARLKHDGKTSIKGRNKPQEVSKEVFDVEEYEKQNISTDHSKVERKQKSVEDLEIGRASPQYPETGDQNTRRQRTKPTANKKRKSFSNASDFNKNSKSRKLEDSSKNNERTKNCGKTDYDSSCEAVDTVVLDDTDSPVIYISDSSLDVDSKGENARTDTSTPEQSKVNRLKTPSMEQSAFWSSNKLGSSEAAGIRPYAVETSNGVVVILPHPSEYIFKGKAKVSLLVGKVVIQGYHLVPMTPTTIFSPECNSLLTIKTIQSENSIADAISNVTELLSLSDSQETDIKNAMEKLKSFIVLHVTKHKSRSCDVITSLDPFTRLFEVREDGTEVNRALVPLGVALLTRSNMPCLDVGRQQEEVLQLWSGEGGNACPSSILVCGGKDCGKSTTNRMLMNSALNNQEASNKPLYYLECDVGQSEFTPPGCVSLVEVTAPLLGPPFCNQRQPIYSCAYGGLSPKDDPDRYLACVKQCVERYSLLDKPGRLVVNTMGWMTGLGLQLLMDTIRLVQPQCIVQLTSPQKYQNALPLTPDSFTSTSWSDLSKNGCFESFKSSHYQPTIIHIDQPITPGLMSKFRASDHRNLSLLSHVCADLEPELTLTSKLPFCIRMEDVAVHVFDSDIPQSQVMYSLNASLVALCRADTSKATKYVDDGPLFFTTSPVCEWLGYGIVRGVDPDKKLLYVLTALPLHRLEMVNTLLKGSVTIPDKLLLSQKCKDLAYVDNSKKSLGASSVKPRRHMPRKSLGGPGQNN